MFEVVFKTNKNVLLYELLRHKNTFSDLIWSECVNNKLKFSIYKKFIKNTPFSVKKYSQNVKKFMNDCLARDEFLVLSKETEIYKNDLEKMWRKSEKNILKIVKSIIHMPIEGKYNVYVVHRDSGAGHSVHREKKNTLVWGHHSEFDNYDIVYITHEIFHSILPVGYIPHAVQNFAIDNELRTRLNNCKYSAKNIVTHPFLKTIMVKILPYWREYLKSDKETIFDFIKRMQIVFKKEETEFNNR